MLTKHYNCVKSPFSALATRYQVFAFSPRAGRQARGGPEGGREGGSPLCGGSGSPRLGGPRRARPRPRPPPCRGPPGTESRGKRGAVGGGGDGARAKVADETQKEKKEAPT